MISMRSETLCVFVIKKRKVKEMKTTQKRWISVLLAVLMVAFAMSAGLLSASAMPEVRAENAAEDASGTCGENLTWVFKAETGELTISGTGKMDDFSDWNTSPWRLSNQNDIKTVTISDGVTTIGGYAFHYCINLTSVTIPDSVTKICEGAFAHCWSLADVLIPPA